MVHEDSGSTKGADLDSNKILYMDIKEFREGGYLQEVNRRFLHPLGLALEIDVHADGSESLGGIWDSRRDPEGICFDEGNQEQRRGRQEKVDEQERLRQSARTQGLGYWIQPLGEY